MQRKTLHIYFLPRQWAAAYALNEELDRVEFIIFMPQTEWGEEEKVELNRVNGEGEERE